MPRAPWTPRTPASALAQALGWLLLLATAYPWLWDKSGAPLFKLDAWVYYHAVAQWHSGGNLYDWYGNPHDHLWPFTYPPFAAWAMTPLTWVDDRSAQVLMVLVTPLCTAVTAWATARALGVHPRDAVAAAPWLGVLGVVVLEPVHKTMEYGQVNAVLMMLVAVDLLVVPAGSRWRGVGTGVAAAFKLTPAIAVLALLARREWRAAATTTATTAVVTAACWAISPSESTRFFLSAMLDPSRAGFADYSGNQNLKGMIARWLPEAWWTPAWALAAAAACLGAWFLLRRLDALRPADDGAAGGSAADDGAASTDTVRSSTPGLDEGTVLTLQLGVAMVLGLLVSPISWSHHWVWFLPVVMALTATALRLGSATAGVLALSGTAVAALAMHWWFPEQNHAEQDWPLAATVPGSSYTLWALGAGVALWALLRPRARRMTAPATTQASAPTPDEAPARTSTGRPGGTSSSPTDTTGTRRHDSRDFAGPRRPRQTP